MLTTSCNRFAVLALVLSIGCSTEGPHRVGSVVLLPGDPPPPTLSADALLVEITGNERDELNQWIASLTRPAPSDCPAPNYYSLLSLEVAVQGLFVAEFRPNCQATFEDVAACAVVVDDCETTGESPGACGTFLLPECEPDLPID